jgi:hypothetical protein
VSVYELHCLFGVLWDEITCDTDDECLPDWLPVLAIPCNTAHTAIGGATGKTFSHRPEFRTREAGKRMYMAVARETSRAGS